MKHFHDLTQRRGTSGAGFSDRSTSQHALRHLRSVFSIQFFLSMCQCVNLQTQFILIPLSGRMSSRGNPSR